MQIMQNMKPCKICKFQIPNHRTKLPKQTCQTNPAKLDLPNQTYQAKHAKLIHDGCVSTNFQ